MECFSLKHTCQYIEVSRTKELQHLRQSLCRSTFQYKQAYLTYTKERPHLFNYTVHSCIIKYLHSSLLKGFKKKDNNTMKYNHQDLQGEISVDVLSS